MESNYPIDMDSSNISDPLRTDQNHASKGEESAAIEPRKGQDLQDGEIIRIELFEEVPTIHRETVVREKIQIRKISTQENA